jgi:two-component system response regulator ChvI
MASSFEAAEKKTVMVVDDDKDTLRISELGLEKAGFQVHAFSDPTLALKHIEQGSCQVCEVLISDVRMPHMNGFQLVKKIRQFRPEMKVVIMTAFEISKEEFQSVFPSICIHSVIKKPFSTSKLATNIEKICLSESRPLK